MGQAFIFHLHTVWPPASYMALLVGGKPANRDGQTLIDNDHIGNKLRNKGDVILLINAARYAVELTAVTPWPRDQFLTRT